MTNIFDYIELNKDKELIEINKFDALIFSRLVYLPFEIITTSDEDNITIEELNNRCSSLDKKSFNKKDDKKLIKVLNESSRYKNLIISNIVCKYLLEKEQQFIAITINLPNNSVFVSFRGTTKELIGWKEDAVISYMTIDSEKDASKYVNNIKAKNIYLGGHSKGGHLAMYAAMNSYKKRRIRKIYNFDGPGFYELNRKYYKIKEKIITYLPENSIVGRLFFFDNDYVIVKSNAISGFQHNVYTWYIEDNDFILGKFNKQSDFFNNTIDEWISKTTKEERKKFVDIFFDIILSTGAETYEEINLLKLKEIANAYKNIDEESKKLITDLISLFIKSGKKNIRNK